MSGSLFRNASPDHVLLGRIRKRELDDEPDASQERRIDDFLFVRGQNRQPAIALQLLEQVVDLDISIAVMAPSPSCVCRTGHRPHRTRGWHQLLRQPQNSLKVLFCLANVLADHFAEVDSVQIQPQLACKGLGG